MSRDPISNAVLNECARVLGRPERLLALAETGLWASGNEESFDRLTRLASKILKAPLSIVSLIGKDQQLFKSHHGLPEQWASDPLIDVENSVCRFSLYGQPLVIEDARNVSALAGNPAIPALNLVAYLGVPLITGAGENLGAFCAIDTVPRKWTADEIEVLQELTQAVMREIELKASARALAESIRELESERDLRERFVITLTHDLRNPLASAKLTADANVRHVDKPQRMREGLERISRNLSRVDSMIQTMLDASRLRSGETLAIRREPCDLRAVAASVIEDQSEAIVGRIRLVADTSVIGNWNTADLKRVIENLVSNAIKYGASDTPITLTVRTSPDAAELEVHNFGATISPAEVAKVFEPFHRSESAVTGVQRGWGLGLTFVRGMVGAYGGTVRVESDAERGTRFSIALPF